MTYHSGMINKEIRRLNFLGLCDKHSRKSVAKKMGYLDTSYINQITNKNTKTKIGDKVARKIERVMCLPDGWMDVPHTELWPESECRNSPKLSENDFISKYEAAPLATRNAINLLLGINAEEQ